MELVHRRSDPRRHARIREFRLRPENGHVPPYPAGSHIDVAVLIDGQPARRSYSLVGERDPDTYRIAVRLAPDSRGGSRYMWNLQAGRADRNLKSDVAARNRLDAARTIA